MLFVVRCALFVLCRSLVGVCLVCCVCCRCVLLVVVCVLCVVCGSGVVCSMFGGVVCCFV